MASEPPGSEPHRTSVDEDKSHGLRPILTDLNGDSSWLISLPRPSPERAETGKTYYHIVLDPWLAEGPIALGSSWIAQFSRREPASIASAAAVDALVREIERAAGSAAHAGAGVDALCVCSFGPDHMHYDTLKGFAPSIPVFTTPGPTRMMARWRHFERIVPMAAFDTGAGAGAGTWRAAHPGAPLPGWLSLLRVNTASLCFGVGIVWSPDDDDDDDDGGGGGAHEALLYFPHGCDVDNDAAVARFLEASPRVRPLALMHPVKDTLRGSSILTSGVRRGIKFWRKMSPDYWIQSGNGLLDYSGPFYWGVKDHERTLDWGLEMEKQETEDKNVVLDRPNLVKVGNGKQFVLK